MHRDIKPANILYDIENKITKVIDFGSADYFESDIAYSVTVNYKNKITIILIINLLDYYS